MKGTLDGGGGLSLQANVLGKVWGREERTNSKRNRGTAEIKAHQRQCQAAACSLMVALRIAKLQFVPADTPQHASQLLLQHEFSVRTAKLS